MYSLDPERPAALAREHSPGHSVVLLHRRPEPVRVQTGDVGLALLRDPLATTALPSKWTWFVSRLAFAREKPKSFWNTKMT